MTEQAAALGLSNEIGYGKRVTFLKNIIGLWLLQESRREYARQGKNYSFAEIETMARQSHEPSSFIDPDDPVFFDTSCPVSFTSMTCPPIIP